MLPSGATEQYDTLGALLYGLNRRRFDSEERLMGHTSSTKAILVTGESCEVIQACNHLGLRLTSLDGNCQNMIDAFLNEVAQYAQDEAGRSKRPWEMTEAQWGALTSFSGALYGLIPYFSHTHMSQSCVTEAGEQCRPLEYGLDLFYRRFGYGHNGPTFDGKQINSRHDLHVGYALAAGKPVPASVIAGYRRPEFMERSPEKWFLALLEKPYLRGKTTPDRLQMLINILGFKDETACEITEENADHLFGLIKHLPEGAGYIEMDNALFLGGVVREREVKFSATDWDIGKPHNEFASAARMMVAAHQKKAEYARAAQGLEKGDCSLREASYKRKLADSYEVRTTYCHANRLAKAVESRDIDYLLSLLDGDGNEASKLAIESFYPVKLRNVKAAQRRRALFALAGYVSDQDHATAEAALKTRQEAKRAALDVIQEVKRKTSAAEHAKWRASSVQYRVKGKTMSGAEFVEMVIGQGFVQLTTRKVGAVTHHHIANPGTSQSYRLRVKDGTLDYAKAVLERQAETA